MKRHPLTAAIDEALQPPLVAPSPRDHTFDRDVLGAAVYVNGELVDPLTVSWTGVDYARGPGYGVTVIGRLLPDGTLQVLVEYERSRCDQPLLLLAR